MDAERRHDGAEGEPGAPDTVRLVVATALIAVRLDRGRGCPPVVDQLVECLAAAMRTGRITAGVRLPSIRALARRVGVSVHTVVEVYDRLAALGLTISRPGAGVFVARQAAVDPLPPTALSAPDTADPLGLAEAAIGAREAALAPGSGFLPGAWVEDAWQGPALARFHRKLAAALPTAAPPRGHAELRMQIAARLARLGIPATADRVLVTHGATQALDLVIRALLAPGDTVLVEDPGFFMLFPMLERHGVRMLPVPRRRDGPDLAAVATACRQHRPRAFFVQPVLHNPTGWTATPASLHQLLGLAERHGMLLIEDDAYGDMHPDRPVRLAQLGVGSDCVVHLASFTKVLGPAIRVGFVLADAARLEQLLRLKVLSTLTGSGIEELLLAEMLASGQYRRHLDRLWPRIAAARALATRRLAEAGFDVGDGAEAGLFLWAAMPDAEAAATLAMQARRQGVVLARGDLFRPGCLPSRHFRFNVARSTDPRLVEILTAARCG